MTDSSAHGTVNPVPRVSASSPGSSRSNDARTAARLLALILSLLWGVVPGFGLIDLETAMPPGDPMFRKHWFLEGSWGLFITALVVVPLLIVVLTPSRAREVAQQLHVMAGGAIAAGVLCLEFSMIGLAAGFVITAWAVWSPLRDEAVAVDERGCGARRSWAVAVVAVYAGVPMLFGPEAYTGKVARLLVGVLGPVGWLAFAPRVAVSGAPQKGRSRWLIVVSFLWFGPWLVYAVTTSQAYWEGLRYVGTVERVSAHVAFVLIVGIIPLVASIGWLPIRLPVSSACIAGGGIGAFALLYPTHLLSPGSEWGVAAILGCLAMLSVAEIALRRQGSREYLARTPLLDPP